MVRRWTGCESPREGSAAPLAHATGLFLALEEFMDGLRRYAEALGGVGLVAVGEVDGFQEELFANTGEVVLEGETLLRCRQVEMGIIALQDGIVEEEVICLQDLFRRPEDGTAEGVLELAHISGPLVTAESLEGSGGEIRDSGAPMLVSPSLSVRDAVAVVDAVCPASLSAYRLRTEMPSAMSPARTPMERNAVSHLRTFPIWSTCAMWTASW